MLAGCLALLTGTAVTLAAIQTASAAAFLAGTAVAGVGFGTAMLGDFRTISTLVYCAVIAVFAAVAAAGLIFRGAPPRAASAARHDDRCAGLHVLPWECCVIHG
jgi:hypothetical protein